MYGYTQATGKHVGVLLVGVSNALAVFNYCLVFCCGRRLKINGGNRPGIEKESP